MDDPNNLNASRSNAYIRPPMYLYPSPGKLTGSRKRRAFASNGPHSVSKDSDTVLTGSTSGAKLDEADDERMTPPTGTGTIATPSTLVPASTCKLYNGNNNANTNTNTHLVPKVTPMRFSNQDFVDTSSYCPSPVLTPISHHQTPDHIVGTSASCTTSRATPTAFTSSPVSKEMSIFNQLTLRSPRLSKSPGSSFSNYTKTMKSAATNSSSITGSGAEIAHNQNYYPSPMKTVPLTIITSGMCDNSFLNKDCIPSSKERRKTISTFISPRKTIPKLNTRPRSSDFPLSTAFHSQAQNDKDAHSSGTLLSPEYAFMKTEEVEESPQSSSSSKPTLGYRNHVISEEFSAGVAGGKTSSQAFKMDHEVGQFYWQNNQNSTSMNHSDSNSFIIDVEPGADDVRNKNKEIPPRPYLSPPIHVLTLNNSVDNHHDTLRRSAWNKSGSRSLFKPASTFSIEALNEMVRSNDSSGSLSDSGDENDTDFFFLGSPEDMLASQKLSHCDNNDRGTSKKSKLSGNFFNSNGLPADRTFQHLKHPNPNSRLPPSGDNMKRKQSSTVSLFGMNIIHENSISNASLADFSYSSKQTSSNTFSIRREKSDNSLGLSIDLDNSMNNYTDCRNRDIVTPPVITRAMTSPPPLKSRSTASRN